MNEEIVECPFCQDLDPESRRKHPLWIADLKVSTAFLSHNQICRGYTVLVYNKCHATELFQLDAEDQQAYSEDLIKVAKAIHDTYQPHKMNYELLGNVVPHLHWHVIPRRTTDSIELRWPIWGKDYTKVSLSDDECRKIVEEIREHLST